MTSMMIMVPPQHRQFSRASGSSVGSSVGGGATSAVAARAFEMIVAVCAGEEAIVGMRWNLRGSAWRRKRRMSPSAARVMICCRVAPDLR